MSADPFSNEAGNSQGFSVHRDNDRQPDDSPGPHAKIVGLRQYRNLGKWCFVPHHHGRFPHSSI